MEASADKRCWSSSLAITAAFIALGMVWLYPLNHPGTSWYGPPDITIVNAAGRDLLSGRLRAVYANNYLYALPLSFPITGSIAFVAGLFTSHGGFPLFMAEGPCIAALGVFPVQASRRLAWEMGQRRNLWVPQLAALALVLVPGLQWGHVEDVLALACTLHCLRYLVRHDTVRASVYLSIAISFKQWAVMLVPLMVFSAPSGRRIRALCYCMLLPALLAAVFLVIDFHEAVAAFLAPPTLAGAPGHPGIAASWLGSHTAQVNRTSATVLSASVAFLRRHKLDTAQDLLLSAGLILLLRPLAESVNFTYYWSPALMVLALATICAAQKTRVAGITAAFLAVMWSLPAPDPGRSLLWWAGELFLLGLLTFEALRAAAPSKRDFERPLIHLAQV